MGLIALVLYLVLRLQDLLLKPRGRVRVQPRGCTRCTPSPELQEALPRPELAQPLFWNVTPRENGGMVCSFETEFVYINSKFCSKASPTDVLYIIRHCIWMWEEKRTVFVARCHFVKLSMFFFKDWPDGQGSPILLILKKLT